MSFQPIKTFYAPGGKAKKTVTMPGVSNFERSKLSLASHSSGGAQNLENQRRNLPVYGVRESLVLELRKHPTVIIIGETGCGKTTQMPQFVFEEKLNGEKMIAITQPRRLAAVSLSNRVAEEMKCSLGETVGYTIRFENVSSNQTKIKFVTDGMLLREAMEDTQLMSYSVIFLDEAHERNVNTDVLFGVVKKAQALRKERKTPLRIVIMSATMDVDHFKKYFDSAPVIYLEGRQFPIEIFHAKEPQQDRIFSVLCTVRQINEKEPSGDVLVFLSGSEEIEAMVHCIRTISKMLPPNVRQMRAFPVYAALPVRQMEIIFRPVGSNERKIIVATNVAETSITIPGIKFVVDSGLVKAKSFDPATGLELLKKQKISQAQASQRAGRAGRSSSGKCYRAYTKQEFESLPEFPIPEIMRCNLASTILVLLRMGIDAYTFEFMDKPSAALMDAAISKLEMLGAIDSRSNRKLTELGRQMSHFPLDPSLSKVILSAKNHGCVDEILSVVSLLSGESAFYRPVSQQELRKANEAHEKFLSSEGDHVTLLNVFRQYNAAKTKKQWCEANFLNHRNLKFACEIRKDLVMRLNRHNVPMSSCGQDTEMLRKCLITGLFTNVAELQRNKKYLTLSHRQEVSIHPSSSLRQLYPQYVIFSEIIRTNKSYIRTVSVVNPEWLRELAPEYFRSHRIGHSIASVET